MIELRWYVRYEPYIGKDLGGYTRQIKTLQYRQDTSTSMSNPPLWTNWTDVPTWSVPLE